MTSTTELPASRAQTRKADERASLTRQFGSRYQVVRTLGRGGMGVVFLCRDRLMHRAVAIKVLRTEFAESREHRSAFLVEARLAAQFDDDGIVPMLDVLDDAGVIALVMPHAGASLAEHIRTYGPLSAENTRALLIRLGGTLARLHRRGIVHRDLKPENILLGDGEGVERAKLTDFGIAVSRLADRGFPRHLGIAGSPGFMPPEQALDPQSADQRSDLYALGAVGYFALTAAQPFQSESLIEALELKQRERFAPLSRPGLIVPRGLDRAITRCLRANPNRRWPDAGAMVDALAGDAAAAAGRSRRAELATRIRRTMTGAWRLLVRRDPGLVAISRRSH